MGKDSKAYTLILLVIFSFFIFLQIKFSQNESLTWDEPGHYQEGLAAITKNVFTISPNSPTFIPQLTVLPAVFGLNGLIFSRLIIVILAVFLGLCIYVFTANIFDPLTGILAVFLFLFEPTILAHSHYITLDMGFTLFFFIAYWLTIVFLQKPNLTMALFTGLATGLMFSAKVTGIGFFLLSILLLVLVKRIKVNKFPKKYLILWILAIFISIWFTYRFSWGSLGGFTENGTRLSNKIYLKLEEKNIYLAKTFKQILTMPLPLGDFPRIVKNAFVFNINPKTSFFMGQVRQTNGLLFLLLFLLKTPLPFLIFLLFGMLLILKKRGGLILIIPIVSVLIFVFASKIDLRLRYLLPIYPYLAILGAYGFTSSVYKYKNFRIPLILLLVWFAIGAKSFFPHPISFNNELTPFFGKPYLVFSDSNIDWGQGLADLKKYVERNNLGTVYLSYYGIDDPNKYGFLGFVKNNICKRTCIIDKTYPNYEKKDNVITALSITNWQECGWYKNKSYSEELIKDIVGGSILIFTTK